jgi:CP family cyanate transporter-like MFS transporter
MTKRASLFAYLTVILIASTLRPPVASVGPLLSEVTSNLGLNPAQLGIVTSVPVLCFGFGAFAGPWVVRKLGLHHALFWILVSLLLATALRGVDGFITLLVCSIVVGLAIAVANVILPTVIRSDYPNLIAPLTVAYTMTMAVSASLAATIAVPLSLDLGGWRVSMAVWAVVILAAVLVWAPHLRGREPEVPQTQDVAKAQRSAVSRSSITWWIVAFFGIQSAGFYVVLNWLPSVLSDYGLSRSAAGSILGLATIVGVPVGVLLGPLYRRLKSLSWLAVGLSTFTLSGYLIVWLAPSIATAGSIIIGLGQASTFPVSLYLIGTKAQSEGMTTRLSALAQGWGYLVAAVATFGAGFLRASSGGWALPLGVIVALTVIQLVSGYFVGRPGAIANPS